MGLSAADTLHQDAMLRVAVSMANTPYVLKGGTALLFTRGLQRHSTDLDFDAPKAINMEGRVRDAFSDAGLTIDAFNVRKDTEHKQRYMVHYQDQCGIKGRLKIETKLGVDTSGENVEVVNGVRTYVVGTIIDQKLDALDQRDSVRDLHDVGHLLATHIEHFTPAQLREADRLHGDLDGLAARMRLDHESDPVLSRQSLDVMVLQNRELVDAALKNAGNEDRQDRRLDMAERQQPVEILTNEQLSASIAKTGAKLDKQPGLLPNAREDIMELVNRDVAMFGANSPAILGQAAGQSGPLFKELAAAQSAVELSRAARRRIDRGEDVQQEARSMGIQQSQNPYIAGVAQSLASASPEFARGYYAARQIAGSFLRTPQAFTARLSPKQTVHAAMASPGPKSTQDHILTRAFAGYFLDPHNAIERGQQFVADRIEMGQDYDQAIGALVTALKDKPTEFGLPRKFEKGLLKRVDTEVRDKAFRGIKNGLSEYGGSLRQAVISVEHRQEKLFDHVRAGVPAPDDRVRDDIKLGSNTREADRTVTSKLDAVGDRLEKELGRTALLDDDTGAGLLSNAADRVRSFRKELKTAQAQVRSVSVAREQSIKMQLGPLGRKR